MPLNLDPELEATLAALYADHKTLPPPTLGDVLTRRSTVGEGIRALAGTMPDSVKTTDHFATAADGHKILLRLYQLKDADQGQSECSLPLVFYIHGGGMILGSVDIYNAIVGGYVAKTGVPFLAVDYRLAPEHPYPTPVDDCCTGLAWLKEHAPGLGIDLNRVALMGDSAGGGLAVLTAAKHVLQLARLILLAPMLDNRTTEADEHLSRVISWSVDDNMTGWSSFLRNTQGGDIIKEHPVVPARMNDEEVARLPSLYMDVGELDLFRDETIQLASRALKVGVSVELHVYPGCTHGFDLFAPKAAVSVQAVANRIRVIVGYERIGKEKPQ